ncbi:beta-N-acetylhexosaminidase [Macrococcus lamae]|uniref:beta-N-acetylhexosaminidase n=1 Tax=Macrococcus lamae TaxID=198484 RepID=A0A4R6BY72_9STAP|nr:beta-N-acetylhexosaminidase [Macrococcus lamae]TDM13033.1 beta-N-acetylhexosaminidase [Macrococcus lamae]
MRALFLVTLAIFSLASCQQHHSYKNFNEKMSYKKLEQVDLTHLIVDRMTLEEKIYQSLIIGFDGTVMTPELTDLTHHQLGGVILFKRNIQSADQVMTLNHAIYSSQQEIPLFIGVDQEGGRVNRLPAELGNTESAFYLSSLGDQNIVYQRGRWIGDTLKALHFNLDFSTVLDIRTNPANTVIGDRSFGTTPDQVTTMAGAFNRGIMDAGIVTSGKHFPGHGDTFADSHQSLPINTYDMDRLKNVELKPFNALKDELDMIMVSHIQMQQLDNAPSSLSKAVVTDLLRKDIGYNGVIITDDMAMGAITSHYNQIDAVKQAFKAGNTMVLIGSDTGNIPYLVKQIEQEVASSQLSEKKLNENVEKILRLKSKYGIL